MTKARRADRIPLRPLDGRGAGTDEIELGRVSGVFSFRGEVRLFLHNPETEAFDDPRRVVLVRPDGGRMEATLAVRPGAGKRIIGRITGVNDEAAAQALMGCTLYVARADLPEPDDGFYVADVLGWPVFMGGRPIGTVAGIHPTDGDDVLEIAGGAEPRFVPMVEDYVLDVDFDGKRVLLADDALDEA